ncbi:hypothetical protein EH223_19075 [candidate division KSB1 bacterium]|nr:hypothetical protein [candidate division KSB1 bacterium]RQW00300.1 MAG: hypothetical protein EH223_19075 [candidate division KSB1 bacterium]
MKTSLSKKMAPLSLVTLLFVLAKCFNPFAPKLDSSHGPPLVITPQRSPEEVLQNFVYAYTFKDSLVYADLLDSSFVFVYFDPNIGSSGRFVSWGRDVDLKTTGRLFKTFETITLTWNSTIYQDTTFVDTTIASIQLSKTLQLNLFGKNEEYTLSGSAIFDFRSCEDKKWRITRWKDESTM